jgi:putative resolvase
MYTLSVSHEASRMGEATGPRLPDGVSLVPGRILPVPSKQLPTGTILVEPVPLAEKRGAAVYARVASGDQKKDLDRQLVRLVEHATAKGLSIVKSVSEIGSGLNGHRPKLIGLLRDPTIGAIVVEHGDRLVRFGSEYIEAALPSTGRKVVVVDEKERKDDLVQDMIEVLTSFCRRLYGRRSAKNKAKRAMEAIEHE